MVGMEEILWWWLTGLEPNQLVMQKWSDIIVPMPRAEAMLEAE
jgi:hypothetical protein